MQEKYALSLFIFRRDLRLHDNSALIAALRSSKEVLVCFIFDDRQIGDENAYRSSNAIQFMLTSLLDLSEEIKANNGKLYFFKGISEKVVATILKECPIEAVFLNRDYTPFSRKRDKAIQQICDDFKIDFHVYADALLHEPEQVLKSDKKPYTVYTPATRCARQFEVVKPHPKVSYHFYQKNISCENKNIFTQILQSSSPNLYFPGGRNAGLKLLSNIKNLKNYKEDRDYPSKKGTTHLSPHNKFGTLSIREVYFKIYEEFGAQHTLINELYWRDFFTHIAFHFPRVFSHAFQEKFQNIVWSTNEKHLQAWCNGLTGFPIVDAGMRELNATGYMHNRVRMITASFLCKDLHLNWQEGEKYFAKQLVDYDASVNNGNWQWASSTGCDAQPYFRIFNPWLQQAKFDPDCTYIKRWVPELASLIPKDIHSGKITIKGYPAPIVDHAEATKQAKHLYQVAAKG